MGGGYSPRRSKQWFALLLCLCLIGTTVPVTARAEDPTAENQVDVDAAKSRIENHTWTVEQGTANTPSDVITWIEEQLGTMNLNDVTYTVSRVGDFTEATAGTAEDRDGTNGSFAFKVDLCKGLAVAYISRVNGTITATTYSGPSVQTLDAPANPAWDSITPGKAKWDSVANATGYTVTLYKDGAEEKTDSTSSTEYDFTSNIITAGSYTFKVKATGAGYTDSAEAESSSQTFYAVSFDTNGGGTIPTQIVVSGGTVTKPADPTKAGYKFDTWQDSSTLNNIWVFTTQVSADTTLYAKWRSTDAGVTAVSVAGTQGQISGNTITVVLPHGSTIPTNPSAVSVTTAAGATHSPLSTGDNGATWTFTVTAEDDQTTKSYTINVSVAADQRAENQAAVNAAKSLIERHNWTVAQGTANSRETVRTWIGQQLGTMNLNGVTYTVYMTSDFTAAIAGTVEDTDGTNGRFVFNLFLSKGTGVANAYIHTSDVNGTITATAYGNGGGSGNPGSSSGSSHRHSGGSGSSSGSSTTATKTTAPAESTAGSSSPFTDVSEADWYYPDVAFVYACGLLGGTGDGSFAPYASVNRLSLAELFYRMEGSPAVAGRNSFTDVVYDPNTPESYNAVTWARQSGVLTGFSDNTFRPGSPITREQFALAFYNYAKYKGYDVSQPGALDSYADGTTVSAWSRDAVTWAVGTGIISGRTDQIFAPQSETMNAEFAVILHRFIEKYRIVPVFSPSGDGTILWIKLPDVAA